MFLVESLFFASIIEIPESLCKCHVPHLVNFQRQTTNSNTIVLLLLLLLLLLLYVFVFVWRSGQAGEDGHVNIITVKCNLVFFHVNTSCKPIYRLPLSISSFCVFLAGNYVRRQIERWAKQYEASKTQEIPAMDKLILWLTQNIPENDSTSVVHGDFRCMSVKLPPPLTHCG